MPPIVMHSYRQQDYPGNSVVVPFTVAPSGVLYSDWIDVGAPALISTILNVQGLADPEYVELLPRGLFGYRDAEAPAATPDGGATDGTGILVTGGAPGPVVISASEYEERKLNPAPRWLYLVLSAPAENVNTADVTVSLAI